MGLVLLRDVAASREGIDTTRYPVSVAAARTPQIFSLDAFQQYIRWGPDGDAIQVLNVPAFSEKVLPQYFKHNNFQSFQRQLNMYSFSKTRHDSHWREFRHPYFKRGRPDLLVLIKRKTNTSTQAYVAKSHGALSAAMASYSANDYAGGEGGGGDDDDEGGGREAGGEAPQEVRRGGWLERDVCVCVWLW